MDSESSDFEDSDVMLAEEEKSDRIDELLSEKYGDSSSELNEDELSDFDMELLENVQKRKRKLSVSTSSSSSKRSCSTFNESSQQFDPCQSTSTAEANIESNTTGSDERKTRKSKLEIGLNFSFNFQILNSNFINNVIRFFLEKDIVEIENKIAAGTMICKQREASRRSQAWSTFEEVFEVGNGNKPTLYVKCTLCSGLVYKPTSNTNPMLRHRCQNDKNMYIQVMPIDKAYLKLNAAKFISKDLRPAFAVECDGLLDLCTACMEFGQIYRNAIREDLVRAMPSRNTVKNAVSMIANSNREKISVLLKNAIDTGGISATTDTWQDNYRKATYISIVVHLTIDNSQEIKRHRFVLSTSEITSLVKTGNRLKFFYQQCLF